MLPFLGTVEHRRSSAVLQQQKTIYIKKTSLIYRQAYCVSFRSWQLWLQTSHKAIISFFLQSVNFSRTQSAYCPKMTTVKLALRSARNAFCLICPEGQRTVGDGTNKDNSADVGSCSTKGDISRRGCAEL